MSLTIELAVTLVGAALTLLGFWWGLARWILAEFAKRDLAIQTVDARAKLAEEVISKTLADHKLYAAENFATSHEVAVAITGVQQSIDKLSERLDKILMLRGGQGVGG